MGERLCNTISTSRSGGRGWRKKTTSFSRKFLEWAARGAAGSAKVPERIANLQNGKGKEKKEKGKQVPRRNGRRWGGRGKRNFAMHQTVSRGCTSADKDLALPLRPLSITSSSLLFLRPREFPAALRYTAFSNLQPRSEPNSTSAKTRDSRRTANLHGIPKPCTQILISRFPQPFFESLTSEPRISVS